MLSSKTLSFEKLGEENYPVWKVYMEAMLVRKSLMDIVDGTKVMPMGSPGSKAVITFKRAQAEAHTEIILCLEPSQLPHARSADPKVIWDELDAVHRLRGFATRLALRRKFLFLTKKTDQPMQSWIAEVRDAAHHLLDADAEASKASEEDIILVLTQGLTSKFDNFVVTLDTTAASNLTLDYVIARLLNEEARQGVIHQSAADSALAATSTHHNLQIVCPWHGLEAASCRSHATMKPSRADQANLTTGGLGVAEGGWETAMSGSSRDLRTQKWHSDRLSLSVGFTC